MSGYHQRLETTIRRQPHWHHSGHDPVSKCTVQHPNDDIDQGIGDVDTDGSFILLNINYADTHHG